MAEPWNSCPGKLETSQSHLDVSLCHLLWGTLPWMIPKGFQPQSCGILCFCRAGVPAQIPQGCVFLPVLICTFWGLVHPGFIWTAPVTSDGIEPHCFNKRLEMFIYPRYLKFPFPQIIFILPKVHPLAHFPPYFHVEFHMIMIIWPQNPPG